MTTQLLSTSEPQISSFLNEDKSLKEGAVIVSQLNDLTMYSLFENGKIKYKSVTFDSKDNLVSGSFLSEQVFKYSELDKLNEYLQDDVEYSINMLLGKPNVRLYYHNNRWYLSTYNKLDAFSSSKNGDKSIGKRFIDNLRYTYITNDNFNQLYHVENLDDLFDRFTSTLDVSLTHVFCLSTSNTGLWHVGSLYKNIPYSYVVPGIQSNLVTKTACKLYIQKFALTDRFLDLLYSSGLIITNNTTNKSCIILSPIEESRRNLKHKVGNLYSYIPYLVIKCSEHEYKTNFKAILQLFPELNVDKILEDFDNNCSKVYSNYVNAYIYKTGEYKTKLLKKIHKYYLKNLKKDHSHITYDIVANIIAENNYISPKSQNN